MDHLPNWAAGWTGLYECLTMHPEQPWRTQARLAGLISELLNRIDVRLANIREEGAYRGRLLAAQHQITVWLSSRPTIQLSGCL